MRATSLLHILFFFLPVFYLSPLNVCHLFRNPRSHVHPRAETGTVQSACRPSASQSRPTVAICSVVRAPACTLKQTQTDKKVSEQMGF